MVQGAAMPRSTCSPSGTSDVVVSAATAPEISTERPSGRHSPSSRLTRLTAGFDRVAGAVHAFGGEVLKFIGDGVLAMFPVTGAPAEACEAALRAVSAARAGMAHLDAAPQAQGLSR